MRKVKMLKDCQAYVDVHKIKDFKKGEEYDVSEFLFDSFTKSGRAISLEDKIDEEKEAGELGEGEKESEKVIEEKTEEALKLDNEQEVGKSEDINFVTMTKEKLKDYCKKVGVVLKGNPSQETIINKIKEVQNDTIK